jgi:hypothetical protein
VQRIDAAGGDRCIEHGEPWQAALGRPPSTTTGSNTGCNKGSVLTGETAVPLAWNQAAPAGIHYVGGAVYWTTYAASGQVLSLRGGSITVISDGQSYPWAITADDTNVYWTNYGSPDATAPGSTGGGGAVMQAPIGGGTPITLASPVDGPWGIADDSTNVYYTAYGGGRVHKVPKGGGTNTVLASGPNGPVGIAVGPQTVYWANFQNGKISWVNPLLPPGLLPPDLVDVVTHPFGVWASGNVSFFTSNTSVTSIGSSSGGGGAVTLASGQNLPWAVRSNASYVYFITNQNGLGTLSRVPIGGAPSRSW